MKTKNFFLFFLVLTGCFCLGLNSQILSAGLPPQDDPVLVPNVATVPVVDGIGDDICWQNVPWQNIDEVWIPYDGSVTASDYTGRYKLVWSSATNLLYFLMEVIDDKLVDGFNPNSGSANYNFDISEVFIDENDSGGEHRYDGPNLNAENAFAYHMYADYPAEGEVTTSVLVNDMSGTMATSYQINYSSHFPEFAMRVSGTTTVREFSLIVYNDTYVNTNPEASRSILAADKVFGMSVAYCDNDNPNENPIVRDNMYGSVWEPSPGNLHWMNADTFGNIKLVNELPTSVETQSASVISSVKIFPNPASSFMQLQMENNYTGEVSIRLYNILGQQVFSESFTKSQNVMLQKFQWGRLVPGPYFMMLQMGGTFITNKLLITDK